MQFLRNLARNVSRYIDLIFLIKFAVLMTGIYYFNLFFIGITDPKGMVYSPFLTHNLDYISWLRSSILYTAKLITNVFGLYPYVADRYTLKVPQGHSVIIGLTCIGYGVMSFWTAFIIAQKTNWKKKLGWSLAGIVAIWFINCWRVGILLIALQNKWQVNRFVDHHEMFNMASYLLIMLMIYIYYQQSKKEEAKLAKTIVKKQPENVYHLQTNSTISAD